MVLFYTTTKKNLISREKKIKKRICLRPDFARPKFGRSGKLLFNINQSTDFLLFSNILTFQNYMVVVCNRTMNDIDR